VSRRIRQDQPFGSDSFLDVIANIVGILIILIVIVGMKVANQAVEPPQPAIVSVPDPALKALEEVTRRRQELDAELLNARAAWERASGVHVNAVATAEDLQRELDAAAERTQGLSSRLKQLEDEAAELGDANLVVNLELSKAESQEQEAVKRTGKLTEQLTALENQDVHAALKLASVAQDLKNLRSDAQLIEAETQKLQEMLEEIDEQPTGPMDRLRHRLSPLSSYASEDEVHFRLDGGAVSHIPVDDLIERLKSQVKARSATIQRFSRYDGTVGPVEGYVMSYVVKREGMSALQSMQYGVRGYRVAVSRWTISPTPGIIAETPDEAVQPGSRYRQVVETLRPGSTVTIWVYPNSFSGFPALREVAHGLQLKVAARPLPEGTPIVGSPAGSQSRAQ